MGSASARRIRWHSRHLTTTLGSTPSCVPTLCCSYLPHGSLQLGVFNLSLCSPHESRHFGVVNLFMLSLCEPSLPLALLILTCLCILAVLLPDHGYRRSPPSGRSSSPSRRHERYNGDFGLFVSSVPQWACIAGLLRALALGSKAALRDVAGLCTRVDDLLFGSGRFFLVFHPPSSIVLHGDEHADEDMETACGEEMTLGVEAEIERILPRSSSTGSMGVSALWVCEGRTSRLGAFVKLIGFGTLRQWTGFASHLLRSVGQICDDRPAVTVPFQEVKSALPALAACGPFDMSAGDLLDAHAASSNTRHGDHPLPIAEVLIHLPLLTDKFATSYPTTWAVLKKFFAQLTISAHDGSVRDASAGGSDSLPLLGTVCISGTGVEIRFRLSDGELVVGGSQATTVKGSNGTPGAASLEKRPWLAQGCAPATRLLWDPRPGYELNFDVRLNAQIGSLLQLGLPAFVAPTIRLAAKLMIVDERRHPGGRDGGDTAARLEVANRSGGHPQRRRVGGLADGALDGGAAGAVIEIRLVEIGIFFGERFFSRLFPVGALRVSRHPAPSPLIPASPLPLV